MSETLIGVLVGGLIASITPVLTLIYNHYQWKRQAKLEYLIKERERLEKLFDETLQKFSAGFSNNLYDSDMTSDIVMLMPKEVNDRFWEFIKDDPKDVQKGKLVYFDISLAMKKVLKDLNDEINLLLS